MSEIIQYNFQGWEVKDSETSDFLPEISGYSCFEPSSAMYIFQLAYHHALKKIKLAFHGERAAGLTTSSSRTQTSPTLQS